MSRPTLRMESSSEIDQSGALWSRLEPNFRDLQRLRLPGPGSPDVIRIDEVPGVCRLYAQIGCSTSRKCRSLP